MKIDHLVVNVDKSIQEDKALIHSIESIGLPYNPKWGKGTKGFKVSNIWIGNEYFELVSIKRPDGGGWVKDWTTKYIEGHRGLIGFALEVDNIDKVYEAIKTRDVIISPPEPLKFRWFFNLLHKTMPWRNSYVTAFEGIPFQFFLQQMNDEKSKQFMHQYMVPNSRDHDINGISEVNIYGNVTDKDKEIINVLFEEYEVHNDILTINLAAQKIRFIPSDTYKVEVILSCNNDNYSGKEIHFNNIHIINS